MLCTMQPAGTMAPSNGKAAIFADAARGTASAIIDCRRRFTGCVESEPCDESHEIRSSHTKIHRVALVDNDPRALESLSLLIEAKVPTAYVVWTATSGDEAIERCQRNDDNLNLLVLDMSMEGLQGPAICHRIRLMDRHLPILGITSFSINSYRSRLMEPERRD